MDKKNTLKILGLHRAEFEKAKTKEKHSWMCEGVVGATAVLSILAGIIEPYISQFTNVAWIIYALTIIALTSSVVKWVFSFQVKRHKNIAERARRVLLLINGLDYVISQKEIIDLITSFSVTEEEGKQWEDPSYFISARKAGYERLASMIQESTFFSKHLYAASAKRSWLWFIITFLTSIAILFILPGVRSQIWSIAIAQIICTLLMFLTSIDFLGRALEYSEASTTTGRVDDRLENFQASNFSENDLVLIWGDYNAAVQEAPLIPTFIYEKHKDRLTCLFSQRVKKPSPSR